MPATPRVVFTSEVAPRLAQRAGLKGEPFVGVSRRFGWLQDDRALTVVAGEHEGRACDLALAYGLREARGRRLQLLLPESEAGATLLRLAWLKPTEGVAVWTYGAPSDAPERRRSPSRTVASREYVDRIDANASEARGAERLEGEFRSASLPLHLGKRADWARPLVDWVASRDDLDPAHRRGERAWHCRGQKVLRITGVGRGERGLRIEAGIQRDDLRISLDIHGPIERRGLDLAIVAIERAVALRLTPGEEFYRFDEHWLQSVLRRDPHLVGIDGIALREVPAWRRTGGLNPTSRSAWGRGYLDLLGVDAHGTVRIVETKLATNDDPLFILQGVDYLAYCEAYRQPITRRLDVHAKAPFAITYALGAPQKQGLKLSRFVPAQLEALGDDVDHQLLTLTGWTKAPRRVTEARVTTLEPSGVRTLARA